MKKSSVCFLSFVVFSFFIPVSWAQQLSRQGQSLFRNAEISLRNVKKDLKLFDGTQLVPNARLDRCDNHVKTNMTNLNRAIGYFNKIPQQDRGIPQVKAMEKTIQEMGKYLMDMQAAVKAAAEGAKGADDQCRAFENEIMKPVENRTVMSSLTGALNDPGYLKYNTADQVNKAFAVIKAVKEVCEKPNYKDVGKVGCRWMKVGSNRQRDPSAWCEVAARGTELVRQAVIAHVKFANTVSTRMIMKPEELEKRDGWLQYEPPVTYKTHLYFGDVLKAKLLEQFKPLFEAAGIEGVDNPELFSAQVEALDKLREAVDKLAPTWKLAPAKSCNYGCEKAKSQIVKWYRGALDVRISLKKTIMTSGEWHITKNALGVPLERSKAGFVVFQVPGEKFCQARSFTLTEKYSGGGKYQKSDGVRFGYVRFQNCK